MQKIKNKLKAIIKKDSYLYRFISKIYHFLSRKKYELTHYKQEKELKNRYKKCIEQALITIKKYEHKDYMVFYNPTWLGVANSTKGLFKNIVPLEQVLEKKNVKKVATAVASSHVETIIFSQIVDGWIEIIEKIKEIAPDTKIKIIWHGNCYEFFSDYTWDLNKKVIELYEKGKIDCIAFVRKTMSEFYKKAGFKTCYLQNNVKLSKTEMEISEKARKEIKIGIYNADTRELKNIYTALSAIRLVGNATADVVPINEGAKQFAEILGLATDCINDYIPTEDLMKRIQKNTINIYPTYTENAPMFPLESFEMGVPCLLGNNNDYFIGTKLGKYVILEREDDPVYIKEKIEDCIKHKAEIMQLYHEWKKDFNEKCEKLVQNFIKA